MKLMEIISSLGLLLLILVAFGVMAGGRAPSVLRPAIRIVERLLSFAVRSIVRVFGTVFRISGGSIKLPKVKNSETGNKTGPPPSRWND